MWIPSPFFKSGFIEEVVIYGVVLLPSCSAISVMPLPYFVSKRGCCCDGIPSDARFRRPSVSHKCECLACHMAWPIVSMEIWKDGKMGPGVGRQDAKTGLPVTVGSFYDFLPSSICVLRQALPYYPHPPPFPPYPTASLEDLMLNLMSKMT
jgi:hypothetical protein